MLTTEQKLERLERVVETLIGWLQPQLGNHGIEKLFTMMNDGEFEDFK